MEQFAELIRWQSKKTFFLPVNSFLSNPLNRQRSPSFEVSRMKPFVLFFLIGLQQVTFSSGDDPLDCSCIAHENVYRIIGGERSTEWFQSDHAMPHCNKTFVAKTTPKLSR